MCKFKTFQENLQRLYTHDCDDTFSLVGFFNHDLIVWPLCSICKCLDRSSTIANKSICCKKCYIWVFSNMQTLVRQNLTKYLWNNLSAIFSNPPCIHYDSIIAYLTHTSLHRYTLRLQTKSFHCNGILESPLVICAFSFIHSDHL